MEKYKIAIVGQGGIGSYLSRHLYELDNNNQLNNGSRSVEITVFDGDTVDVKNLTYQDFEEYDVTDYKAEVIGIRYGWNYETTRVESSKILDDFDLVVAAVDNSDFRKMLYEWGEKNPDKYWIDLRSEGTAVLYYTKNIKNPLKKMLETLVDTPKEGVSCQLDWELESGIVQQGNKIIAAIGSQLVLNYLRKDFNAPHFTARF